LYYTTKELQKIVGVSRQALVHLWNVGKGPNRITDGHYRIPKADALAWAEDMARTSRPTYAPKYERAAQFMRMDLHLDQGVYAV
jgi:hypothetical protein